MQCELLKSVELIENNSAESFCTTLITSSQHHAQELIFQKDNFNQKEASN